MKRSKVIIPGNSPSSESTLPTYVEGGQGIILAYFRRSLNKKVRYEDKGDKSQLRRITPLSIKVSQKKTDSFYNSPAKARSNLYLGLTLTQKSKQFVLYYYNPRDGSCS